MAQSKKRILFFIDCLGSGGAQRQIIELAIAFKRDGNYVRFLTYHESTYYKNTLRKEAIVESCLVEPNYLKRIFKIRSFIREFEPDVVISFLEGPSFIAEIAGIPFRKWILIVGERSANPAILKSHKLKLYRWFHLFADYVVANSSANLNLVKKINPLLPDRKCKIIYNMVDLEYWKPESPVSINPGPIIKIVIAASHQYTKNLNILIECLNLMPENVLKMLSISWYGDRLVPPYNDASINEGRDKIFNYKLTEFINFFPATHNIRDIMLEADVIGLFSFYEGLPNAICEGMACGKPVLVSDVSDISLFVREKRLIFDPNKVESLLAAFQYLISLTKKELVDIGKCNRDSAEMYFSKEHIMNAYKSLMVKNG